jgi:hypothetical protein
MKQLLLILGVTLGLTGCNITHLVGPPAAMEIKDTDYTMIGNYNYPSVRTGSFGNMDVTANLSVTDGELSCEGYADYNENTTRQIEMPINCSDGSTGNAIIVLNPSSVRNMISGVGKGTLSNGKKFRIVIGQLSGSIGW